MGLEQLFVVDLLSQQLRRSEADEEEIALSMSTIFFFNILAVFIFPVLGHIWHMSNFQFGLWSGTAINDTSSVVAAAFSYSKAAGEMATIVKVNTRPYDCTSLFGLDRFKMVSE